MVGYGTGSRGHPEKSDLRSPNYRRNRHFGTLVVHCFVEMHVEALTYSLVPCPRICLGIFCQLNPVKISRHSPMKKVLLLLSESVIATKDNMGPYPSKQSAPKPHSFLRSHLPSHRNNRAHASPNIHRFYHPHSCHHRDPSCPI